ncbi:MAG: hypothetical protein ABL919_03430 [Methylococcales bacterium]|nr:hypothetical protein [Methylococcaceae bacterium]
MRIFNKTLLTFCVIVFSSISNAALVTTNGTDFSFTYDDLLIGRFGTPNITGNSLFFVPTNHSLVQENLSGSKLLKSNFTVTINSLQGSKIDFVALNENGKYLLEGEKAGISLKGALTAIDAFDPFSGYESEIAPVAPFEQTEFDGPLGQWEASTLLDLPDTTSVIVSIENILRAKIFSGNVGDELALIETKFLGIFVGDLPINTNVEVSRVPLPQAVWLFGAGMFGLLSISKRKRFI